MSLQLQAQDSEDLTFEDIVESADSVYLSGSDTIYVIDDTSSDTLGVGRFGKKQITNPLIYDSNTTNNNIISTTGGDITINLSNNLESINKGLFGINVTGFFDQNTSPNDGSAEDQWDWLAEMKPQVLRFPSGAGSHFMHLLSGEKGYGYDILEIIQFFDATDGSLDIDLTDEGEIETILETTDATLFHPWLFDQLADRFDEFKKAYILQENLTTNTLYIDDFIALIKQIEQAHTGHVVDVILCLNIFSEPAEECKAIVDYMRSSTLNGNWNINVVGVEFGNEVANSFHEKTLFFENFPDYWDYMNGEIITAQAGLESTLCEDIFLDPTERDYFQVFKNTPGFTCKVGLCADGIHDAENVFFTENVDTRGSEVLTWNEHLYEAYNDIIVPGTKKTYFDAVIMHTYYTAKEGGTGGTDWWQKAATDNLLSTYPCYDEEEDDWDFDVIDSRLEDAFSDVGLYWRQFILFYFGIGMADFNDELHFELTNANKKDLWITEYNLLTGSDDRAYAFVNTFMHIYILQEWWLRNMKLNYSPGYRKNFLKYTTLQNYAGGSQIALLTPADEDVELEIVGYDYSPYNLGTMHPNKRNYYIQRTTKFTMDLVSNINGLSLKYMKLGIGTYSHNPNVPPTIFIDPEYENIYIYYTNVKETSQNYIIEDGSLRFLYPGAPAITLDDATITCIDAAMPYSSSGKSFLYGANACYDETYPYDIEIDEVITYPNISECSGSVPENHCITVRPYSSGFIKIPVAPDFTPPRLASESFRSFLYPNPADENIIISNLLFTDFIILDITERAIQSGVNLNNQIAINYLPAGYYVLQCKNANETIAYFSFVKY